MNPNYSTGGSSANIYNPSTGKVGYQVPGAAIPTGWAATSAGSLNGSMTSPAVITSAPAVNQTNGNIQYANNLTAVANTPRVQNNTTKDNLGSFISTSRGDTTSAVDQARMQEISRLSAQLDGLSSSMDSRSAEQIQSVKAEMDRLAEQQKVANTNFEGGVSTAGLASGRSRYAGEIQAGIQSQAVNSGIAALTDIQSKKAKAVMEIEQARDERKYTLLQARIKELNTLQKEERQAAQDMVENFYKEQSYYRQNAEFVGQSLAPTITSMMTGDPSHDEQLITEIASQNQVSPAVLQKYVQDYKTAQYKALPDWQQKYDAAKTLGYKGSALNFILPKESGTKADTLSLADVKSAGLPRELVGLPTNTIVQSLGSPIAPSWYVTLANKTSDVKLTPDEVQAYWTNFKERTQTSSGNDMTTYPTVTEKVPAVTQTSTPIPETKSSGSWFNLFD